MSKHRKEASLYTALETLGIAYAVVEHSPVFTVAESTEIHRQIPGAHTKNLFLKDAGGQYWLVTVPHDKRVDLKALPAVFGSKRVSFGKGEDMERLLGITPGSVTPLAAFNDADGVVRVVLDQSLAEAALVQVHPLRNSATASLTGADLVRALTAWKHPPLIVEIPAV